MPHDITRLDNLDSSGQSKSPCRSGPGSGMHPPRAARGRPPPLLPAISPTSATRTWRELWVHSPAGNRTSPEVLGAMFHLQKASSVWSSWSRPLDGCQTCQSKLDSCGLSCSSATIT